MSVQATIIKGISTLLRKQDFVVLPDFGGFVLNSRPAYFSDGARQLLPPSKQLSFNSQTKQNDGVLVSYLQSELGCDYAAALQHVTEFTSYCKFVLQAKRRISLEGIGFFYLDFEGNTCFEPQRDLNYLPESFGLSALQIKPLTTEPDKVVTPKPMQVEDRVVSTFTTPQKRTIRLRPIYVSSVIVLLLITLLMLMVSERKMTGQLQAALGIPTEKSSYSYQAYAPLSLVTAAKPSSSYVGDANGIAVLDLKEENKLAVIVDEEKLATTGSGTYAGYELVFGCFSNPSNAKRLTHKLANLGMRAVISKRLHKGMQVVCSKSYASKEAAMAALEKIHTSQPKAWLREIE